MDDVRSIAAGYYHSMAVTNDGRLWVWGGNEFGQIGDGTRVDYLSPMKIMDNVKSITAGAEHSMAIKTDGSLWTWGINYDGQLGDGTKEYRYSPVKIMDDVSSITAGTEHSMAIKTDGSLWAWGFNSTGPLGDGTTEDRYSPVKIMDGVMLPADIDTTPATPQDPPASDAPSSWAVDSVNAAIKYNLVPETLQSKYTQAATRAEFCALAVALYENIKGEITGRIEFSDTDDVNVQKAAAVGVVGGVGGNRFDPAAKLTREQAAAMLARLADAVGKPLAESAPAFADNDEISAWASVSVGQVQAASIMGGVGSNKFDPKGDYTREQSIITIMRLYDAVR